MTDKWKHIRPSEYDWDYFKDTNGRETSMVRTLITGDVHTGQGIQMLGFWKRTAVFF